MFILILGLVSGVLTTMSAVPQVIKTLKTKKTSDLSLGTYILVTVGILLWLIYGILLVDIPLIAANIVSVVLNSIILFYKLKYG